MYFEGSENAPNEVVSDENYDTSEGVIQLKENKIPKGLITLEKLFEKHDRYVNEKQ